MHQDQFWQLMGELDGEADEETVHHLTELLAEEDEEDVAAFGELVRAHIAQIQSSYAEELGGTPLTDTRACGVVAAGKASFDAALVNPAGIPTHEDTEALLLLTAADDALEMLAPHPGARAEAGQDGWLTLSLAFDCGLPFSYQSTIGALNESMAVSLDWKKWWAKADSPQLHVVMNVVASPLGLVPEHVRRKRRQIVAQINLDGERLRSLCPPGRASAADQRAREDVRTCLSAVREALDLGDLPELPMGGRKVE
ncbi:DUF4240 domain-containing protein [Streptomyces albipurpureus]|uniref:DUF4240 domain-containing protein n=1 Tax=Streptomyces albipurpureus TaxID=2897419 RepID=A0ABT0UXQ3_9ACTN|nr:hypothetical protein [Streptomyces sp. CWNU-1]MCM2393241.1 hypothetical protein [Streptomyces sp. CWNU-1]